MTSRGRGLDQITREDLFDVLQREFAPINLRTQGDGRVLTTLGMALVPYYGVDTAAEYLSRVNAQLPAPGYSDAVSPMQLPQMLDHLSLSLGLHPNWSGKGLIHAPDLRSAGTLMLGAANDVQFRDRMAALASVLGSLQAPAVPGEVVAARFNGQAPGSLQRLGYWLEANLPDAGRRRAIAALDDVREAVRLRVEDHHPSHDVRQRAAKARARLGLPGLILDWSAAWDIVRIRVAEAFDVIRQEVQIASS